MQRYMVNVVGNGYHEGIHEHTEGCDLANKCYDITAEIEFAEERGYERRGEQTAVDVCNVAKAAEARGAKAERERLLHWWGTKSGHPMTWWEVRDHLAEGTIYAAGSECPCYTQSSRGDHGEVCGCWCHSEPKKLEPIPPHDKFDKLVSTVNAIAEELQKRQLSPSKPNCIFENHPHDGPCMIAKLRDKA